MRELISKVAKAGPFLGGFLISISILNSMVKYWIFDIRIIEYIDFSEALLLFLDQFIWVAVAGFMILYISIFTFTILGKFRKKSIKHIAVETKDPIPQESKNFTRPVFGKPFYIVVAIVFIITTLISATSPKPILWIGLNSAFYIISFILLYSCDMIVKTLNKNNLGDLAILLSVVIITIAVIYITTDNAMENFSKKYNKSKTMSYQFYINDSLQYKTGDSLVYIGKTSKYIFLYNRNTDQKIIFKSDDVKNTFIK
ncbi:MAG TPA: hypothetical protein VHK91_06085 [Flavisolibacter sp.]|jgi:hypothetical protein|nr:hypothetical protein [Flavisolibacter sp.]